MIEITNLDAKEVFEMLEHAGMNPQWCDTPVPYFNASVQAGLPTDPGDIPFGEQLMMAQDFARGSLTFCVNVRGDSMKDADITDGDRVELLTGVPIRDGDIVIAEIDKDCYTLKSYMTDEQGNHWLVPANKNFKPIMLTGEMDVRILGKVMRVFKEVPRMSYAELMKIVNETKGKDEVKRKEVPAERIAEIIRDMGDVVKNGRQWYAVFRPMVDVEALEACDYDLFVEKVSELLPAHKCLPVVPELRRMAVQSFRKKVSEWKESDAPVGGHHFRDYLRIANLTKEKLQR